MRSAVVYLNNVPIPKKPDEYEGILPKGPSLPCLRMAGRALLTWLHSEVAFSGYRKHQDYIMEKESTSTCQK